MCQPWAETRIMKRDNDDFSDGDCFMTRADDFYSGCVMKKQVDFSVPK